MGRILKAILVLLLAAVLGTVVYAYFGDMSADPVEMRSPVALPDLAPAPPSALPAVPAAALVPTEPAQTPPAAAHPAQVPAAAGAGLDE